MDPLIRKYGAVTLRIILKNGNRARYNQILEDFPATSGTLSRVLKVLEQEGFISREIDPNSRPPVAYYSVTDKGVKEVEKEMENHYMALMEFDPEEAEQLLNELIERLKQRKQS
ncbi:transcriptional regulator [Archaeoglobus sp.]